MSLESLALTRFDRLLQAGDLLWKPVPPHHHPSAPFDFEFRIAESLLAKPQDKEQKPPAPSSSPNLFNDPSPDFHLGTFGTKHKLILNKFSVVRPQFVLPTLSFEPQRNPLTLEDFAAVWQVMLGLGERYVAIFNCGVDAGSSVGHKHLQVIPLPEESRGRGFLTVLLERIEERDVNGGIHSLEEAPFKHAASRLARDVDPARLFEMWRLLCGNVEIGEGSPHNLLLTRKLIVAVPRRKAWMGEGEGEFSCNAAGMAGIVWCKTEAQYRAWMEYGPMRALGEFGVGLEGDSA